MGYARYGKYKTVAQVDPKAKPTEDEQKQVTQHLFNILEPTQTFSAEDFNKLATEKINEIFAKNTGKTPQRATINIGRSIVVKIKDFFATICIYSR